MRIYSASSEETLRTRKLLKEWANDGVLTEVQRQRLEQETPSELRTTNIFLRLVLFFFTVIIVCAAVGLFFVLFLSRSSEQTTGVFLLVFAAVCYAAAEFAVSQARLYHHGIEEALAVCSVGLFCLGVRTAIFSGLHYSDPTRFLVPAIGAVVSLWIWHRFELWYGFLAAMICAVFVPGYWTSSHSAQHAIVAAIYTVVLIFLATVRVPHRFDYLEEAYSLAEALLWLGIYLAINLKLSSLDLPSRWWDGSIPPTSEFAVPFYWTTWVMMWCLPPIVIARGIRQRDRFVIEVGAIVALLTLVTNKPYLGWPRHTWDPMLLGILLTGVALFLRRWLARGPKGVQHGFTAERLSGKDKQWLSAGSAVLGLVSPQAITPKQRSSSEFRFGGGSSGGGGASSEF